MPFAPGQSGNPGGRPKENAKVKALAGEYTEEAIGVLAAVMRDPEAKPGERRAAATDLLDRAWGKPAQAITGEGGGAVQLTVDGRWQ